MHRDAVAALDAGLDRIRAELGRAERLPARGGAGGDRRPPRRRPVGPSTIDRTDRPFVTLDPATLDRPRPGVRDRAGSRRRHRAALRHRRRRVVRRARRRRSTTRPGSAASRSTCPTSRPALYPAALSEGAASLLPDVDRPAVVFTRAGRRRRRRHGSTASSGRLVRSRAKLAYDTVARRRPARRVRRAGREDRRGRAAARRPAGRVPRAGARARRRRALDAALRPRLESEDQNAAMSLADQPGGRRRAARRRHRPVPGDGRRSTTGRSNACGTRRRRSGSTWPADQSLADFRALARPRPTRAATAFLVAVRRAGGGASYEPLTDGAEATTAVALGDGGDLRPGHGAAAPAGRPLRDRGGVGRRRRAARRRRVEAAFADLPKAMAQGESSRPTGSIVPCIELAEAVMMSGREGEMFDAVVVDEDRHGIVVQLVDPAVLAHVHARRVDPGDTHPGAPARRRRRRRHDRVRPGRVTGDSGGVGAAGDGAAPEST